MDKKNRRRKIVLIHSLQLRYTFSLLIPFFIIFLFIELQMFFIIKYLLPKVEFLATKNLILESMVLIIIEVFILLFIAAILNIYYLHKIAGPINRIINEIKNMLETKNYHLIKIRKKDELKSLIDEFNKIISKLIESK